MVILKIRNYDMELYHNQSIFKNLGESNMMDQAFEQVLEKNKRNFVSYLFPMVIKLLEEIHRIIADLSNRTYQDRLVVTEELRKCKVVKVHSVTPLTKEEIRDELGKYNLSLIIPYIKDGLNKINHQTISIGELFTILENIHIKTYYFTQCCGDCDGKDLRLYITDILEAMRLSLDIGYGKPEKYNNVFAFLAFHTLNLFELLGV